MMEQMSRSKSMEKAIKEGKLVETTNSHEYAEFLARYLGINALTELSEDVSHRTGRDMSSELLFAQDIKSRKDVLESCFELIQESSAADYKASEIKWSATAKRKEMLLPDMRFLILRESTNRPTSVSAVSQTKEAILGFTSFMITYEDGCEVVYVYEIHLCEDIRGQGVGSLLMKKVEDIGRKVGTSKCMLTVFKTNNKALRWYEHCGYSIDEFSPGPRVLRNGTVKEPTYVILSKSLM